MRSLVRRLSRSAAIPVVVLSVILAACTDRTAPLEPSRSTLEDTIQYMDPGQSYCDEDNFWENGCTAVGTNPPPSPPGGEPCTSTSEGCFGDPGVSDPGDGGTGGGAGGGDGSGGEGSEGDDSPDLSLQQGLNCQKPGSAQEKAFCVRQAVQPATTRYTRIKSAIERIRSRGETCALIADRALTYLDSGRVGVYVYESGMAGGYGVDPHGIAIDARWADLYFDKVEGEGRNLDSVVSGLASAMLL